MTHVWLIMRCVPYEGCSMHGVYSNLRLARKAADDRDKSWNGPVTWDPYTRGANLVTGSNDWELHKIKVDAPAAYY